MAKKTKIGRNNPCPCMSGKKYKKCCFGKTPWQDILNKSLEERFHYFSTRGKNLAFISAIAAALQFDKLDFSSTWGDIKRAVTPDAVRFIHEAILSIWPHNDDLTRVFKLESKDTSGLYVGNYDLPSIGKCVTRHCLYSDTILLVDPFLHPLSVREEYNPILDPKQHITSTIKHALLWLAMEPWIVAGIVKFVRTPGDFDAEINFECMEIERQRFERNPEFKKALDKTIEQNMKSDEVQHMREYMLYSQPDDYILSTLKEMDPNISKKQIDDFFKYLKKRREDHPFLPLHSDKEKSSELIHFTSGTNYEMAKIIAKLSGSHLITDLKSRWLEIEIDRENAQIDDGNWSAFAKAFHEIKWKYIENIDLEKALQLRKENRLNNMRSFFRKLWKEASTGDPFDRENAENLSTELQERTREADYEWEKINSDLVRYFGGTMATGALLAAPAVATGKGSFVAAGIAVAGVTELAVTRMRRKMFPKKYPAGFFLDNA